MQGAVGLLLAILALIAGLLVILLPLKLAAAAMGARRAGWGWCLLALLVASFVHSLGLAVPLLGTLVAFLLAALIFSGILGTTFLRGVGIAILHTVFTALLWFALGLLGLAGTLGAALG